MRPEAPAGALDPRRARVFLPWLVLVMLISTCGVLRFHVVQVDEGFRQACEDPSAIRRPEAELAAALLALGAAPQHSIAGQTSYPMLILGIHSVSCEVFAADAGVIRARVFRMHWLEVYMPRSVDLGLPEMSAPFLDSVLRVVRDAAIFLSP